MNILNSKFTSKYCFRSWVALANKFAKNLIINDTNFSNGESNFGGAIYSENNVKLIDTISQKNVATTFGGINII